MGVAYGLLRDRAARLEQIAIRRFDGLRYNPSRMHIIVRIKTTKWTKAYVAEARDLGWGGTSQDPRQQSVSRTTSWPGSANNPYAEPVTQEASCEAY